MTRDHVPLSLQRRVRRRAGDRCEYCLIAQVGQEATFHVDPIHPRREGGATVTENLGLCCVSCSLRKGARTHVEDPSFGERVKIFNPRLDRWEEHFKVSEDFTILGMTPAGRATIQLLRMNRPVAVGIRREEALKGRYP